MIVPIHNAREAVRLCLNALARNTAYPAELLLIDDASTDPEMLPMLHEFVGRHWNVRLLVNDVNLGFVATVNRGVSETVSDVVILNSDTEVTPGWLRRIAAVATSDTTIATVTPLSDNAGAFSVPRPGEAASLPPALSKDELGRLFSHASLRVMPSTPTGHGFCMFMRRAAIDQVGGFDERAFPRGYGEENDWCMRAAALGWRHVIDDSTLVFHQRSASFGDDRHQLMAAARRTIEDRYPEYGRLVNAFITSDQMARVRARSEEVFIGGNLGPSIRPRLLIAVCQADGGAPTSGVDLAGALDTWFDCFVLRATADELIVSRVIKREAVNLESHPDRNRKRRQGENLSDVHLMAFDHMLTRYDIELVEIRGRLERCFALADGARARGVPVVVSLHDAEVGTSTIHLLETTVGDYPRSSVLGPEVGTSANGMIAEAAADRRSSYTSALDLARTFREVPAVDGSV